MADIEVSCDLQNKKDINASFSDVLDINLQKEIKMGIELNAPLYIGADTNLQKQVTQNTADIADIKSDITDIEGDIGSLDNLATSDKSSLVNAINETLSVLDPTQTADYIKNSKGLESGEISTNASILPWVEEMSHSTFDLSKFTVVGSPNITDDGIASGFSSSNYLQNSTVIFTNLSTISIQGRFKTDTLQNSDASILGIYGWDANFGCNNTTLYASFGGANIVSSLTLLPNTEYDFILKYENNNFTLSVKRTTESNYTTNTNPAISTFNYTGITIGNGAGGAFTGSIDLKQFSITVDGVEVFSGNKTGLDVIKLDDFTKVGSPTITFDGIAKGFSSSNYIKKELSVTSNSNFVITGKITINQVNTNQIPLQIRDTINNTMALSVRVYPSGKRLNFLYKNTSGGNTETLTSVNSIEVGGSYTYKIVAKGSTISIYFNDTLIVNNATNFDNIGFNLINIGYDFYSFNGSIDLNAFKVYVNGDLVYQPLLRIPYTESKTGSKIVNSIYRDRVNDMAEQFGFANYYTLSDTDFTLPQVELYGLIGQRTLRDSYRNGATYWELWSDRTLEIGGVCTSGVEYNLPRSFTSENDYILSVPYSAKTASSFTPTVSGDFIAKGLGVL